MITLNNRKLCENCFTETTVEPCPYCGFIKSSYRHDPVTLAPGSILSGRYMIGGVIGKGGFGITYLAYDLKLDARVAVKEYYPMGLAMRIPGSMQVSVSTVEAGESFRSGAEKFYNEAKMVAKFNGNPNIVSVHDFFYENDTVYFIMGYLQGQTLKSYLKKRKITEGQAVSVFNQISNALLAPHGMNILHRDISPDNIMLCDDGTIRLLDFGAARQVVAEQSQSLSVILKQGFAPLEQYQQRGKQGPWTDIYALGATIYNALTGDMLSDPMSRLEDDSDYAGNPYGISEPLWKIIHKCTMLKSSDRYQDIAQLKGDLVKIGIEQETFTDIEEEISDFLRGRKPSGSTLGSANMTNYASAADPNATVFLKEEGSRESFSNETVALSLQEAQQVQQVQPQYVQQQPVQQQMTKLPNPAQDMPKKKGLHPLAIVLIVIAALFILGIGSIILIVALTAEKVDKNFEASSNKGSYEEDYESADNEGTSSQSTDKSEDTSENAEEVTVEEEQDEEVTPGASEDINDLSDEDAKELADFLSTTEHPNVMDFEFVGAALWNDDDYLSDYFENPDATVIHNPLLVEGGWKGYMHGIPGEYASEGERYFNVNIHSLNDKVSFRIDWWIYRDGNNKEYNEEYSGEGQGKWNDDRTGFTVDFDGNLEITKFIYLDDVEYAFGTYQWISGEKDYIVLCRPDGKMEIVDSRGASSSGSKSSDRSSESSEKLSNDEIVELARKKSGAPLAELDSTDPDGTLNIHLYDDNGTNTSTWDWYYINPETLKGTNFMGDEVDLN